MGIVGIVGTAVTAWVIGIPSMAVNAMDDHNDHRYVANEVNNAQIYEQGIQRFNEREDTLEWRKLKAEDKDEEQIIQLQQNRMENDKELFEKRYGR
jgi:hypothetical protein